MKILLVVTATPDVALSIKKLLELPIFKDQYHEAIVCLLGANANKNYHLPQGLKTVFFLPSLKEEVKQASMYSLPLVDFCKSEKIRMVLFYSDKICQTLAVMISQQLQWECFTEITELKENKLGYEIIRKVYDANLDCSFTCRSSFVASLAQRNCKEKPVLMEYPMRQMGELGQEPNWILKSICSPNNIKNSLETSTLLFVAGRGIGSAKNVERLAKIAKKYNASLGATRAVILNGWSSMDTMIGQSGSITAADICLTFGVSGSAPFIVGIEQAKIIIAINNDSSASIFHTATYGIVADCNEILTAFEED